MALNKGISLCEVDESLLDHFPTQSHSMDLYKQTTSQSTHQQIQAQYHNTNHSLFQTRISFAVHFLVPTVNYKERNKNAANPSSLLPTTTQKTKTKMLPTSAQLLTTLPVLGTLGGSTSGTGSSRLLDVALRDPALIV